MNRYLVFAGLVCVVAFAACVLPARAQASSAVPGEKWTEASSLAALPADLQQALGSGGMSDRGGLFSSSCVVRPGIPSSRFVFAALGPAGAVVAIERGGRAHRVETLEFAKVAGIWRLERRGSGKVDISSSGELIQAHNKSARPARQAAEVGTRQL
jgi:hypothetical protein